MRLSTTLLFILGSTALAAPANNHIIQARDAATVMSALDMVTKSVNALDTAVNSLDSSTNAAALGAIATKSQAVGDTVKKAQTMVEGTGPVSIFAALQVMSSANALTDSLTTTTGDLVSKKPIVDQAGLSSVVGMMLMMQKSASSGFSGAVTEKVPALAKGIAMGSAKKVNDALESAIKVYSMPAMPSANGAAKPSPNGAASKPNGNGKAGKPTPNAGNSTTSIGGKTNSNGSKANSTKNAASGKGQGKMSINLLA